MSDPSTTHAVIARALKAQGVDTLFGLLGDANLFMADAYVRAEGGRFVPAAHETSAVQMALGYAAMTGRVGAATVTHGPAVSNCVTAMIEGVKGSLPVVLLVGDTPGVDPEHPQAVDQPAMAAAAKAGFVQLRSADTVAEDLSAAFRMAEVERRPVLFNMPTELMWAPAVHRDVAAPPPRNRMAPSDGPDMDAVVGLIAAARRPLVLAGRGAIPARDALVKLAERIGAPLATTLKAKNLFRGEPYDLGVFGTLSTPEAGEEIARADLIIAFGAGLNRFTAARGGYLEGKRVIQINDDATRIARLAPADAGLVADPGLAAEAIMRWLDEADIPSSRATDDIDENAVPGAHPVERLSPAPGAVDLTAALMRLETAVPEDRVFVTDGGRFMGAAWTRIDVTGPENFLLTVNVGAIGLGMGHAIGAAVARPDQPTLLVTGDGGFMTGGLNELATAVREGLDLIIIVCNDNAYGAEYVQFADRQMDPALSLFDWPSLAMVAEAMGATGVRVASDAELESAAAAIAGRSGPILIELMLDPAAVPRLQL